MAKLRRPVHSTFDSTDTRGRDPYAGKGYSEVSGHWKKTPTHSALKVPGTGKKAWDAEIERWVV